MSELSRAERFELAKKAREKAKKESQNGGFSRTEVPTFETVCLNPNKSHVIRLIGNAVEMSSAPTDPVVVNRSLIKDDSDNWFTLIWSDDMEHPMNKLKKVVLGKYKWNDELKTRIYDNKDIEVFKRFMTNGIDGNPYNQGMMPQKYILFNCISRDDDWCKEHKHTKVLCWESKKVEKDGKEVEYPTYGIKSSLYNKVWDEYCTIRNRHFEDFDILVRRLDKKTKIGENGYLVVNLAEEKSQIASWESKDGISYSSKMNDDYLTDEEKSYEKYVLKDIPFISKATPCGVILSHLSKFIKDVDKEFNTNLYDEFVEWKAKELEESKKASETKNEVKTSEPSFDNLPKVESEKDELPSDVEEKTIKVKKLAKVETAKFDPMSLVDVFPAIAEMSDEDKSLIVGENNGELEFSVVADCSCPSCENDIPDPITQCPYCGTKFE